MKVSKVPNKVYFVVINQGASSPLCRKDREGKVKQVKLPDVPNEEDLEELGSQEKLIQPDTDVQFVYPNNCYFVPINPDGQPVPLCWKNKEGRVKQVRLSGVPSNLEELEDKNLVWPDAKIQILFPIGPA